ncbi:MAG: NAD(P)/FAD-dependent oxidoreductase [Anaerolineae bacterium]|nr:NAD(P)/FAD-dependent oxidoreductase [Anaerolineae bacterium]
MSEQHTSARRPAVLIIGAGFGGLNAAQTLADQDVDVLVVDRHNFHLFSPLLYQVATSGLEPGEIASPVRGIFRDVSNVRFLLGEVEGIDPAARRVTILSKEGVRHEPYDYLILAAGSQTHTFGIEAVERYGFGLKTLSDGVVLRNHVLKNFEKAAWSDDAAQREALTTIVIVGGGPTGLETSGAFQELLGKVLREEYATQLGDVSGRVILIERLDHLLSPYPERLRRAARRQLESMGVEVVLGETVSDVTPDAVRLSSGRVIPTRTLIWAAGVKASPLARMLGVPLDRSGRVPVTTTLQVIGLQDVYVVGDLAYLEDERGEPYSMVIPVAKQQGQHAARNILRRARGKPQRSFHYHDRGLMATIGRSRAVAWIYYRVQLTGFIAWVAWLGLHLITLMGFRNRLNVFVNWVWNYLTYDRTVRIILEHAARDTSEQEAEPHDQPQDQPHNQPHNEVMPGR